MTIKRIRATQATVWSQDGYQILISYRTPLAIREPNGQVTVAIDCPKGPKAPGLSSTSKRHVREFLKMQSWPSVSGVEHKVLMATVRAVRGW